MKKILYLLTFVFSFLILKSNCYAYVGNMVYNYDEMIPYVSDNHHAIIEKIKDKFRNTDYHFYIYLITKEYNDASGTCSSDWSPSDYSACLNGGHQMDNNGVVLTIFNPIWNNRIYFSGASGISNSNARPTRYGFFPTTDTDSEIKHAQNTAQFQRRFYITLDNVDSLLDSFLSNPVYNRFSNGFSEYLFNFSGINNNLDYSIGSFWQFSSSSGSSATTLTWSYVPIFVYKNFESLSYGTYNRTDSIRQPLNFSYIYNNELHTLNYGDNFPFLNELTDTFDVKSVNKVITYDDDFYGFFNNYLIINNIFDDGSNVDGSFVNCVDNSEDLDFVDNAKLFKNGYCSFDKDNITLSNDNFLNSYFSFSNVIGTNTVSSFLHNNYYYLYSFRVLKPFTPKPTLILFDTSGGTISIPILNIDMQDGGSYLDYTLKFYLSDSLTNINFSSELKAISIVFDKSVNSFYNNKDSFDSFGIFRSFKIKWFSSNPTSSDINDFKNNEDLSKIDGTNRTHSFFTDTTFNTYGFSGIVTAPFRFLYVLEDYSSCSSISLPFPHTNNNLTMSCVRDSIPDSVNPLIIILQTILSGIICYYIGVNTLSTIKEILTPDKDSVEVVNL